MTRQPRAHRRPIIMRATGRNGCCVVCATGPNRGQLCSLPALPGRDKCFRHLYRNVDVTESDGEVPEDEEEQEARENDSFIASSDSSESESSDSSSESSDATSDQELLDEMEMDDSLSGISNSELGDSDDRSSSSNSSSASSSSSTSVVSFHAPPPLPVPAGTLSTRLQRLETMAVALLQEIHALRGIIG